MTIERQKELRRRRRRKEKIQRLRTRIAATHDKKERQRLVEKLRRVSAAAPSEL
jgi:hypothetical protein